MLKQREEEVELEQKMIKDLGFKSAASKKVTWDPNPAGSYLNNIFVDKIQTADPLRFRKDKTKAEVVTAFMQ